jgi:hypothetical protein
VKKRVAIIGAGLFALLASCGIGAAIGGSSGTSAASSDPAVTVTVTTTADAQSEPQATATVTKTATRTVTKTLTAKPKPKPKPKPKGLASQPTGSLTSAQQQAAGSAEDYLSSGEHFSRKGFIQQLKFEGFSVADAAKAVDSLHLDFDKQAVGSAKDYLHSGEHFSHSGLVQQLEYEGFTASQAEHGASGVGL